MTHPARCVQPPPFGPSLWCAPPGCVLVCWHALRPRLTTSARYFQQAPDNFAKSVAAVAAGLRCSCCVTSCKTTPAATYMEKGGQVMVSVLPAPYNSKEEVHLRFKCAVQCN